nr:uncharacterized protein LOC114117997 isoform X2 [Ovis aries]
MDKVLEVPERVGAEFLTQKVSSRTTVQRPDFGNKLGVQCAVDLGAAPRGSPGLIRLSKVIPPSQALLRRQRVGRFLQRPGCLGPLSRRLSSSHTSLCQPEFFCSKELFGGRRKHRGRGDTLASIWVCDLSWKTMGFGWVRGSSSSTWVQVPTCGKQLHLPHAHLRNFRFHLGNIQLPSGYFNLEIPPAFISW